MLEQNQQIIQLLQQEIKARKEESRSADRTGSNSSSASPLIALRNCNLQGRKSRHK